MKHKVIVHEYDVAKLRTRVPLDVLGTFDVDAPKGDDTARTKVKAELARRFPGRRLHGLSSLAAGGFTATMGRPGTGAK